MMKVITTNRKAYRDYEVLETLESGIELKGSEVKSIGQEGLTWKTALPAWKIMRLYYITAI